MIALSDMPHSSLLANACDVLQNADIFTRYEQLRDVPGAPEYLGRPRPIPLVDGARLARRGRGGRSVATGKLGAPAARHDISKAMTTLADLNRLWPADHNAAPWASTPDGSWTRMAGASVRTCPGPAYRPNRGAGTCRRVQLILRQLFETVCPIRFETVLI
jgi:hypothetical protein